MAKIFLSYASEDSIIAQQLYFALSNLKHYVFFDKESLVPGDEYNFKISDAIRESDFSILLLSPDFFSANSYCRTELKIIQSNWPVPTGKIFPVIVREISFDKLPDYIKSVTVMKGEGSVVAEIVQVIQDRLFGFNSNDSVTSKLKKIEIEKQLESHDLEWSLKRKEYLVKLNDKEVTPTNELAMGIVIFCALFSAFVYFYFTDGSEGFFGYLPTLLPLVFGIGSFSVIRSKATKLQKAEKYYIQKRALIAKEMPSDGVDYLAIYK